MHSGMSRELQAALEEVEKTNAEDKPELTTRFGPIMRQSLENNNFDYLTLTLQVSPIRSRISVEYTPTYSETAARRSTTFLLFLDSQTRAEELNVQE